MTPGPATEEAPTGFSFVGQQIVIEGPPSTAGAPYEISFSIDASLVGAIEPEQVTVFRNGVAVDNCADSVSAIPDPCVVSRSVESDGDISIVARTSHFSNWNVGVDKIATLLAITKVDVTLRALSARLTGASNTPIKRALITFTGDGHTLCSAKTDKKGVATCTFARSNRSHVRGEVTARYAGDATRLPATATRNVRNDDSTLPYRAWIKRALDLVERLRKA